MRRVLIGVAVLIVLLVAGLLVAPSFVDWNRWKGEIAARLQQATGREVRIDGPLSLALLPAPTLSAHDIHVANAPGAATPDMVAIGALDIRLAVLPLLTGKIAVTSVALVDPVVELQRLPDGRGNWELKEAAGAAAEPKGEAPGKPAPAPAAGRGGEPSVKIDRLTLRNGTFVYRAGSDVERAEKLNATARIESLDGPYHAEGDVLYRGSPLAFDVSVGRLGEHSPLRVGISTGKDAAKIDVAGDLSLGAQAAFAGKLRLAGNDLGALARLGGAAPPALSGRSFSLNGNLAGSASAFSLSDLDLALDDNRAGGSVRYAPGKPATLDVKLSAGRLDLDKLMAANAAPTTTAAAAAPPPSGGTAAGAAAAPKAPGPLLPQGLRASLDLAVEAIVWRHSPIRQAHLEASLDNGELRVKRLAALLPGSADLAVSGTLSTPGGVPSFAGVAEAEIDSLRGTLDWLGAPATGVPADRLRKTSLSAKLKATQEQIDISALDVSVDATRVTGAATIFLRERPAIGARLAADRLTLDAYLPHETAPAPQPVPGAGGGGAPPAPPAKAGPPVLTRFDANIDAGIDTLTWQGQPLRGIHVAGTLQNGDLNLREATARDAAGVAAKLSGTIGDLGDAAPRIDLGFDFRGDEIERPLRLVVPSFTGRSGGAFSLAGTAKGSLDQLALDATLEALEGRARLSGNASAEAGAAPNFDLALELEHPSYGRLARFFDPAYRVAGGETGPLRLSAKLQGEPQSIAVRDLALVAGPATLSASANVTLAAPRPAIAAEIRIGDVAIDRFLPESRTASLAAAGPILLAQAGGTPRVPAPAPHRWSTDPLNLAALSWFDADVKLSGESVAYGKWRLDKPQMALALKDAVLDVSQLAGKLFGGALDAKGQVDAKGAPAVKASLGLRQTDLRAALVDAAGVSAVEGPGDLDIELTGSGRSVADLVASLDGSGKISAGPGDINGVDLRAISDRLNDINRLADVLDLARGARGRTHYQSLHGTFRVENGVATSNDIQLAADAAEGTAAATVDLPRWQMQSRVSFRLTDHPKAPPLILLIDGPLDDPHKTVDISALEKSLATGGLERLLRPRDSGTAPNPPSGAAPSGQAPAPAERPERALRDLFQNLVKPQR